MNGAQLAQIRESEERCHGMSFLWDILYLKNKFDKTNWIRPIQSES